MALRLGHVNAGGGTEGYPERRYLTSFHSSGTEEWFERLKDPSGDSVLGGVHRYKTGCAQSLTLILIPNTLFYTLISKACASWCVQPTGEQLAGLGVKKAGFGFFGTPPLGAGFFLGGVVVQTVRQAVTMQEAPRGESTSGGNVSRSVSLDQM